MIDTKTRQLVTEEVPIVGIDGDEGRSGLVGLVRSLSGGDVRDDSIVLDLDRFRATWAGLPDDTCLGVNEILELAPAVDLVAGRAGIHERKEDDENSDDDHPAQQSTTHSIGRCGWRAVA